MTALPSFKVDALGKCTVRSPLKLSTKMGDNLYNFVKDGEKVLYSATLDDFKKYGASKAEPPAFEIAGPRQKIYFDPTKVKAAIVTCGGLCPGLNDVIRAIVMELNYRYGTHAIYGIPYGYHGFLPQNKYEPLMLTPDLVSEIHRTGGSILGTSRGGSDTPEIVDALERLNINMLFTIGGDGTQRGAYDIYKEIKHRKLKIAVVGIPKTIDNDIMFVQRTFGFETAFSVAVEAIASAHLEAKGFPNGVGLVKLMGRHSGFIAANAALAVNDVNFVLIPEVKVDLNGENGFLAHLQKRLQARHHAVVCVAEGVGQDWISHERRSLEKDASGNIKLSDVGAFLHGAIVRHFKGKNIPVSMKYIDPSYMIRSAPAVPNDSIFCTQLGQNAVHAAMAGKTAVIVGRWNRAFTHVPMAAIIHRCNQIDPESAFWYSVLEATGQPSDMVNE